MAEVSMTPMGTDNQLSFKPSDIIDIPSRHSIFTARENRRSSTQSDGSKRQLATAEKKDRFKNASEILYWSKTPPPIPHSLENRQWHALQLDLARLNKEENSVFFDHLGRGIKPKPISEPDKAFDFVCYRYIKYCIIFKKLDECYLYLVHPQKRALLKACLTSVIIRILELKDELVQIDQREYHFFEDILQDFQKTYEEIELSIPLFIREERSKVLKDRENVLTLLYDNYLAEWSKKSFKADSKMTREEAILLIQRQTRYYLAVIKSEVARKVLRPKPPDVCEKIQRHVISKWRIHSTCQNTLKEKKKVDRILYMIHEDEHSLQKRKTDPLVLRNAAKIKNNQEEYELDQVLIQDEVFEKEGPYMAWSLFYNIKQWLLEVRAVLGKFPPFPEVEEGGSSLLFSDKDIGTVSDELDVNVVNGVITYPKAEKPKKQKKVKKVPKKSPWGPEEFEYLFEETDCMRDMKDLTLQYRDYWFCKDDSMNILQTHDRELLKEQTRPMIAEMIRLQVDELIRAELENLLYAIDREPRPVPKKSKKKEKDSKDRRSSPRPSSKSKGGSVSADRPVDELFGELVFQGIIKYSPQATLDDFLGDYSYSGSAMDQAKRDPMPALACVRQLVTQFAVLPLSSQILHESAPLIRKLLIAGVRGTGKKLLLRAICHEAGANLFDLTPSNLEGKYDTPQGKKLLMQLIIKVGKAMEPTVFWVGDCEKMFLKKKDKSDTSKPHQWVKVLQKTLKKNIKNGDRMLLIGTTSQPGLTKAKKFNKFFDRILIIPYPDYPSRYLAWKHFIEINIQSPLPPYFDLSSLTKVTTGYPIAAIKETCNGVLTEDRKSKFMFSPMQPSDFVNYIWTQEPIYRDEHEQFLNWYNSTPLAKLRQKRIHAEELDIK